MTEVFVDSGTIRESLARQDYWPAIAQKSFDAGNYTETVLHCRKGLAETPYVLSGRLLYARALFALGQIESARDQLYAVLAVDPDHQSALKLLGDCAFAESDEMTALAHYERVLELDPNCQGVACMLKSLPAERTHTITLLRPEETPVDTAPLRSIPFYTETMGDLYLSQGYPRLAATVFKVLHERSRHPRLLEKLSHAEEKIRAKE